MTDPIANSPSLHAFSTWEPLLRHLWERRTPRQAGPVLQASGRIGRSSWSLPTREFHPRSDRAARRVGMRAEAAAVAVVQQALAGAGVEDVTFTAELSAAGPATVRVLGPSPAVEPAIGHPHPGALLLVEGAVPEPWRRLPAPVRGLGPAPSADPALLARTLRERMPPGAVGATDAELTAAQDRLGLPLPEELKALYGVTRGRWQDWGEDDEAAQRAYMAIGCELFPPDEVYVANASTRSTSWRFAAKEAVVTRDDDAVQGLVGSPGWIVFGDTGGGDRLAVDLTPGPRGHVGQIVLLSHEFNIGAELVADSLTHLVLGRESGPGGGPGPEGPPVVAHVNRRSLPGVEAAAHPGLEVLSIGAWEAEPLSLAPVLGLPRLRTLVAYPGTLADPLEISGLKGLEYLELSPQDWRVLLDAEAVPRSLSAAGIVVHGNQEVLATVALANEILALWDRPQIVRTALEGDLGALG
ncbi:SMI1/KNR4 family protein [Streptomyces cavernicola]|uniref:SMI1/KNR4 family protein n=1 Tax=Streptomyces cavernicola TaxID=3043613 RepID=A0ABT6SGN5_9ACTN|nr:SMI1/KNR4 family protein [Streptomyces sp. B-S-A6]MDI3407130.1 SMI1/KNR4 family protein [Streptomyces sp. B-S-A6]